MKTLIAFLFALFMFQPILAEENANREEEIVLPGSPPQKIFGRYQTDFGFHHDRGFYFSAALGPQWNHSVEKPTAKGIRFGGKINAGWFVANGVALFGAVWGNFLEAATLVAGGPGMAFLFDGPNMGIDFSFGVGRAFNPIQRDDIDDFSETVLAANVAISKYWWLSARTSLGMSIQSGVHGLTLSQENVSTFGWSLGLGLSFLFG